MRKTRIICTLGPASEKNATIREMIAAGTDIFRFNMSHAKHDWVREAVPRVRAIGDELRRGIALLLDTQGPAIRTGAVAHEIVLAVGDILEITVRGASSSEKNSISVNYDDLIDDVSLGDTVLLDNGVMQLRVLEKRDNRIRCEVLTAGTLGSHRHINLPGVHVNLARIDREGPGRCRAWRGAGRRFRRAEFCPAEARPRRAARRFEKKWQPSRRRRENRERGSGRADRRDDPRGGCGPDRARRSRDRMPDGRPADHPAADRETLSAPRQTGIVATHLLESMVENPVPTRAEITDVANAVFEQADAMMLTRRNHLGPLSGGMRGGARSSRAADRAERRRRLREGGDSGGQAAENGRGRGRLWPIRCARAKLIVFTRHGTMARYVSNLRPEHAPIFAFTPDEVVRRQLALCWGTLPVRIDFTDDPNATIEAAEKYLRAQKLIQLERQPGHHQRCPGGNSAGRLRATARGEVGLSERITRARG